MPVIQVHCRPKTTEQLRRARAEITAAAANALDVDPTLVQVFITEYDDEHWSKGLLATSALHSDSDAP